MKKILLTGFKPFLQDRLNPTEQIVLAINKKYYNSELNHQIQTIVLPVEFEKSVSILKDEINRHQPEYVIMMGQASGRDKIQFEKIALNWIQSEHPDESGYHPVRGEIISGQPLASMSNFPIDDLLQKLVDKHPVSLSFSAGAYVCNHLYFNVRMAFPQLKSVFVHFPNLPEQVKSQLNAPALELGAQVDFVVDLLNEILALK